MPMHIRIYGKKNNNLHIYNIVVWMRDLVGIRINLQFVANGK